MFTSICAYQSKHQVIKESGTIDSPVKSKNQVIKESGTIDSPVSKGKK